MKLNIRENVRRINALKRLEMRYLEFKSKNEDKINSKGITIPYSIEIKRMEREIAILKKKIVA